MIGLAAWLLGARLLKDHLFRELVSVDTLRAGWHLAVADARDDFLSEPASWADYAAGLESHLEDISERLRAGRFQPRNLLEVDVPKTGLSARPGSVVPVEESIILHAMLVVLAPRLDDALSNQVYSYRVHPKWRRRLKERGIFQVPPARFPFLKKRTLRRIDPMRSWYEAWPEFAAARRAAAVDLGFNCLTRTDITAYFENIDLGILEVQLRQLLRTEASTFLRLLFLMLNSWTRRTWTGTHVGRGLPQGNDVSSFLANYYLLPMDRALTQFCGRRDSLWYRYVDDVEVYTRTEAEARDAVFHVNAALRRLYLNMQGTKTEIVSGKVLRSLFADPESDVLDAICTRLQKLRGPSSDTKKQTQLLNQLRPIAKRYRSGLPQSVDNLPSLENRKFRRLLTAYGMAGRPYMKKPALAAIKSSPNDRTLSKCLVYLRQLDYRLHEELVHELLGMLESGVLIFPFQESTILDSLQWFHPRDPSPIAARLRRYALGGRIRHWSIRYRAAVAMVTYPYRHDHAASVGARLLDDVHPWVRRAGLMLSTRAQPLVLRDRCREVGYHPCSATSSLARYYYRLITEEEFASELLDRLNAGATHDLHITRITPELFALRASDSTIIRQRFHSLVEALLKHTKSEKLRLSLNLVLSD